MMLDKKTKRELAIDFMENFRNEGTSKDEANVWVSQESLIKLIDSWKTGEQLKNKGFTKDAILFSAHVIMDFKDYLLEELKGDSK